MASIYELTDQYRALEAAAYEDDLEYDEFAARLAQIEDAIEDKTDGYCAVIAGLKADAAAIKEQEQRLAARVGGQGRAASAGAGRCDDRAGARQDQDQAVYGEFSRVDSAGNYRPDRRAGGVF